MDAIALYGRTVVSLIPFLLLFFLIITFYIEVKKKEIAMWEELSRYLLVAAFFFLLSGILQNMEFFIPEYHKEWFLGFAVCYLIIGVVTLKAVTSLGEKMAEAVGGIE